jgi:hypothetical protein
MFGVQAMWCDTPFKNERQQQMSQRLQHCWDRTVALHVSWQLLLPGSRCSPHAPAAVTGAA